MDFHVELSAQAQSDISSIHDWLRSQSAGETGERDFYEMTVGDLSMSLEEGLEQA